MTKRDDPPLLSRLDREREPDLTALDAERSRSAPALPPGWGWHGTPKMKPKNAPGRYAADHERLAAWSKQHGWEDPLVATATQGHGHVVVGRENGDVLCLCGTTGKPHPADTAVGVCERCSSFRRDP